VHRLHRLTPAPFVVRVQFGLEALAEADTVVVPGVADPFGPVPEPVVAALQSAHARGARLASTCVGAFTLAATGLLDGLTATTHWLAADDLARLYPAVRVDAHVLFVDHGRILTSARAAAGLDLGLHMMLNSAGARSLGLAPDAPELAGSNYQFTDEGVVVRGNTAVYATIAHLPALSEHSDA
jgi:transcriptional regulator GlxA family with amidase domain